MSIFYLIFLILTAYFSWRYDGIEEYDSHKQHRLWLMCGYLVCLSGFSYGLGADKFVYMYEFEEYPDNLSATADCISQRMIFNGQMPLWTIVNLCCKVFFDSFYAVQFLESAAINIAVCYIASKYTHRYFLFLIIYFLSLQYFIFNTEVMREGFSLALTLVGIEGYVSGRKWLFFTTLPIAILFHFSAAIALLFLLVRFKISWKTLAIAFVISFFVWFFSDFLLGKMLIFAQGGLETVVKKVFYYSIQATTIFGFIRYAIVYLIFPFIIMYTSLLLEPSEQIRERKEKLVGYMLILGIIASAMTGLIRFYNYTYIYYLIAFADFVYTLLRIKKHLIIRLGTFAGTLFFIALLYFGRYNTTNTFFYEFFYPYTCILDENADVHYRPIAHEEATQIKVEDNNIRDID